MEYRFTYFIGTLMFLPVWYYLWRKQPAEWKRSLYWMGALMLVLGPVANYLWFLRDWWQPQTIFGTKLGIEDLILSFSNSTIVAMIGLILYGSQDQVNFRLKKLVWPIIAIFLLTSILYYLVGWHSFLANALAGFAVTAVLWYKMPATIKVSLMIGVMIFAAVIPIYYLLEFFSPGWIAATWLWQDISGYRVGIIPIEDLLWYMVVGIGFSTLSIYANYEQKTFKKTDN